jgi:hypothetical protein
MRRLHLHVFVDACGWDLVGDRPWFLPELATRQPVETVLGYSSACLPAILSGLRPDQNDQWSFWRYVPVRGPFADDPVVRSLARLPSLAQRAAPLRRRLSRYLADRQSLTGYFELYDVPLPRLEHLAWNETRDLFGDAPLGRGWTAFEELRARGVALHVSNWRLPEPRRFDEAEAAIASGEPDVVFVYAADLDGLLHRHGKQREVVDAALRGYQQRIRRLLALGRARYDDVVVQVFSDHGMTEVTHRVDVGARLRPLSLRWGVDAAWVFDSTMARFWWLRPGVESRVRAALSDGSDGRWLSTEDERRFGVHWPDGRFGDAFFLLEPGRLLLPSDLGRRPVRGMHGYRPDHDDGWATLLSNRPTSSVHALTDLHRTLVEAA